MSNKEHSDGFIVVEKDGRKRNKKQCIPVEKDGRLTNKKQRITFSGFSTNNSFGPLLDMSDVNNDAKSQLNGGINKSTRLLENTSIKMTDVQTFPDFNPSVLKESVKKKRAPRYSYEKNDGGKLVAFTTFSPQSKNESSGIELRIRGGGGDDNGDVPSRPLPLANEGWKPPPRPTVLGIVEWGKEEMGAGELHEPVTTATATTTTPVAITTPVDAVVTATPTVTTQETLTTTQKDKVLPFLCSTTGSIGHRQRYLQQKDGEDHDDVVSRFINTTSSTHTRKHSSGGGDDIDEEVIVEAYPNFAYRVGANEAALVADQAIGTHIRGNVATAVGGVTAVEIVSVYVRVCACVTIINIIISFLSSNAFAGGW